MRDKVGENARLLHIRDAIQFIKDFTTGKSADDFKREAMMRFAVERQLEIIGEASNHLSAKTKAKAPHINWRHIKAFRNIAAHEYFEISPTVMFAIVQTDIPILEAAIAELIADKS